MGGGSFVIPGAGETAGGMGGGPDTKETGESPNGPMSMVSRNGGGTSSDTHQVREVAPERPINGLD